MEPIRILSASEQVAAALREQLLGGKSGEHIPGIYQLADKLNVSRRLVEGALSLLEKEGMLISQGKGKPRKLVLPKGAALRTLKIQILLYDDEDRQTERYLRLHHLLQQAGYTASFAQKTLLDLSMDVKRVANFVKKTDADAWIVSAGPSEVLQWFSSYEKPAFAWFGRAASDSIKLAHTSPIKYPALSQAINRLVELGHSRIVMLVREERRKPVAGFLERFFLEELEKHNIQTSIYNLPDWENSSEGFHKCIDSLFRVSPPTAFIIDGPTLFWLTLQQLAERNIAAPKDISLICFDPDPTFDWARPKIAHFQWQTEPMLRHILRWADHIRRGEDYRRKSRVKAKFIEGGTVGLAPS